MLIQSGDSEVLRDENTLLAHKATLAGVNVTHELYEDMIHVFQMFTWLPTAKAAVNSVGRWVKSTLPKIEEEMRNQGTEINDGRNELPVGTESGVEGGESRMVDADGREVSSLSIPIPFPAEDLAQTPDQVHQHLPTRVLVHLLYLPILSHLSATCLANISHLAHQFFGGQTLTTIPLQPTFHRIIPPPQSGGGDQLCLQLHSTPHHLHIVYMVLQTLHRLLHLSGNI
jgi:hypothetical protein